MDLYSTHQRLLVKSLMMSSGSILELGAGHYSTPIIHEIAASQGRYVQTFDNSKEWIEKFRHLESPTHRVQCVAEWDSVDVTGPFGLVVVDHAPAERRIVDIARMADTTALFVVHDLEDPGYGWEPFISSLECIELDRTLSPWTAIFRGRLK